MFYDTHLNTQFKNIWTSNTQFQYDCKIFNRLKHNFTFPGWWHEWLSKTLDMLHYMCKSYLQKVSFYIIENYDFKILGTSPRGQWIKQDLHQMLRNAYQSIQRFGKFIQNVNTDPLLVLKIEMHKAKCDVITYPCPNLICSISQGMDG